MSIWKNEKVLKAFTALVNADAKVTNETAEDVAKQLSQQTGERITKPMIVAKAGSLGFYVKSENKKSVGVSGEVVRKPQIRQGIETLLSLEKDSLVSLDKASKADLEAVAKALVGLSDQANAEKGLKEPNA